MNCRQWNSTRLGVTPAVPLLRRAKPVSFALIFGDDYVEVVSVKSIPFD
jgi:hypothetical protein